MSVNAPYPFDGYRMYGPRIHQDRRIVYLVRIGDSYDRTTLAYAKYLMSIHLGRWLESWEQVDHINNDSLDDRIENLQILTYGPHSTKHAKGTKKKEYVCESCGNTFIARDDGKEDHRFCSRSCLYDSMRGPKSISQDEYRKMFK